MARVAVDVVIKSEILDPQGKAITAALARTGHPGVTSVRQGKHFDLEVDGTVSDADLEEIAGTLLANPVIETWTVTRLDPAPSAVAAGSAEAEPEAAL
ncbi:phosphoribosylformylglycinamidine synthase subunit PurS [Nakamurella flavida]|uniref:Phosphoribosylformylglycinamidine synthase subunit PurS n=1 Tax=Nakamurella flavida TaxID=363630 RepID=A0A938YH84_9ACTN|nr:phosphoribosylformylglycinamidine synthase subunit PurS [Nakamurella flavida]MBM9477635.1 phosphoribosylformylglycinamidine synthase subunit PurS [Nakamurella flavida]MDP9779185.1 phosphoribosylformylglycinamidine synthase [Nakamurella flavida]